MDKLLKYQKQINEILYTINILNWELKINAPIDSKDDLIKLISKYESRYISLITSKKYETLLLNVINSNDFKKLPTNKQNVIMKVFNNYEKNKKVPKSFLTKYFKLQKTVNISWEIAKEKNDYSLYSKDLKKMISMTKKYYTYINSQDDLYDVMLNEYSLGMTSKQIDKLFNELKEGILPLIPNNNEVNKNYIKENTKEELISTAKYILNYIGFDNNKGTLGIYPHGYTEKICDNDVRIAFKHSNRPTDFVSTIIHEGGHGIFEQNINPELSIFEDSGLNNLFDLHESQSRFYENILGRRKSFWIPIYNDIKKMLNLDLTLDEFIKELNTPQCSLIRTEADELTYCMHIILRYEIERDIFKDKLKVTDIPKVWNQKMKEYLHIEVKKDSDGLMQDVHWSEGSFGYFPSYLLGSIYDGMILEQVEKDIGNIDSILEQGNIKDITNYLIKHIYINGGAFSSSEVIHNLCKKEISAKPLISYFQNKYQNKN